MALTSHRPLFPRDSHFNDDSKENMSKIILPNKKFNFPSDFGSHPEMAIEWWYLTGWLRDLDNKDLGFQITFFRFKTGISAHMNKSFDSSQIIFAHCALSLPAVGKLISVSKIARPGLANVKFSNKDMYLSFENITFYRLKETGKYYLMVNEPDFSLKLIASPPSVNGSFLQPILQGEKGFSQKGPDSKFASYYYSRPNLITKGTLKIKKDSPVSGIGWLDHEWTNNLLMKDFIGWDWVGINLIGGESLMVFRLRKADGSTGWADQSYFDKNQIRRSIKEFRKEKMMESLIDYRNDKLISWNARRVWASPRSAAEYPVEQNLYFYGKKFHIVPLFEDQEVDATDSTGNFYWEGAVKLFEGNTEIGRGYMELTGYDKPLSIGF